jgi:long-chain acyl-CoA synthetase
MNRIWLKSYPPGIPADVEPREDTLKALLETVCARYGDRAAFSNFGATISYRELDSLSRNFAAYLQKVLRIPKGERIAIMMPNVLQYPVALFGALRAGYVVVNVNPLYTPRELRHQLTDSGAVAIIVLDHFAYTVQEAIPGTRVRDVIVSRIGDLFHFPKAQLTNFVVTHVKHMVPEWHIDCAIDLHDALAEGAKQELADVDINGEDVAFLQYTGGTTGVPKGAVLTHRNLAVNVRQTNAWVGSVLKEGEETTVVPLPLYHVFALTAMLTFFALGATIVLITNPRDLPAFVKELKHLRFNAMIGVNTLFKALLEAPGANEIDHSAVKVVVAGGMAVQRAVAERWHRQFGMPIIEGYGLTETSPIVCANPLTIDTYTGTIGLPIPSTEVAIIDDEGNELPPGGVGEICVRGPQVMQGYWQRPEETAAVFADGGWLRTGDIGTMEESGFVKLLDRKKEVIVVSGFKVFPNEVEDVVAMHPGVQEVAAIPARDEGANEAVKVVVMRKDSALTAEELIEHCRKYLTPYKVPKYVMFRDEPMPKSNIGKILRRVVREEERARELAAKGDQDSKRAA